MAVRVATGGKADWALGSSTNYVNIPELRVWTLRTSQEVKEYASSSTSGAKQRISGSDDFEGTLSVYVDRTGTSNASFDVDLGIKTGVTGTLKLYEDSGNFFIAPAYIGDVGYNVDIEGGEIVEADIDFARNGALTYPT